jgi:ABC-2 type transport system ATP-binding protein
MTCILETHNLSKSVDNREIISNVNIHVNKGEIYGFLGPNGAGKTSIMKMITNLWKPTSGTIEIFGETLMPKSYNVLKRMSSIIEFPNFFSALSGKDNLDLHCEYMGFYSPDSVEQALHLLELPVNDSKPVRNYSLGMKQRLGIARAILTKPELLVLDEPMNGLDPSGMKQIRDLLKMLCKEYGITILISSHLLSEVESIADTIGIIQQGKMLNEISMADITESNLAYTEIEVNDTLRASVVLSDIFHITNFKVFNDRKIRIYDLTATTSDIMQAFGENNVVLETIVKKSGTLEDYFLKITAEVHNA